MIRVVVAESGANTSCGTQAALKSEPDLHAVAVVGDGRLAVDAAVRHRADIVVANLDLPLLDGLGVISETRRVRPECAVVILANPGTPPDVLAALTVGARAFLSEFAPGTCLADVLRRVHAGARYVDPVLAAEALTAVKSPLTVREGVVLREAGEFRPVGEVARALHLSSGTVRNYLSTATKKLHAGSRSEAVHLAITNGWI